jgi:hypothetical protein
MKPKRRAVEFIIDPSSGQLSASRFLLMVLVLVYLPALLTLEAIGIRFGMWAQFAIIVSSVAGIYWFNSAARVWKEEGKPPPPRPPKGE